MEACTAPGVKLPQASHSLFSFDSFLCTSELVSGLPSRTAACFLGTWKLRSASRVHCVTLALLASLSWNLRHNADFATADPTDDCCDMTKRDNLLTIALSIWNKLDERDRPALCVCNAPSAGLESQTLTVRLFERLAPCGFEIREVNGVLRALTPESKARFETFVRDYEKVRTQEGWGSPKPDYYPPSTPPRTFEILSVLVQEEMSCI